MASRLLIDEPPLQVQPSLALALGLNEAIFVQQLHYWLQRSQHRDEQGRAFVYNSLPAWQRQFPFWSEDTVQRLIRRLEESGVVVSWMGEGVDRTKRYRLDYAVLDGLVSPAGSSPQDAPPSPQIADERSAGCGGVNRTMRSLTRDLASISETTTETNAEIDRSGGREDFGPLDLDGPLFDYYTEPATKAYADTANEAIRQWAQRGMIPTQQQLRDAAEAGCRWWRETHNTAPKGPPNAFVSALSDILKGGNGIRDRANGKPPGGAYRPESDSDIRARLQREREALTAKGATHEH